MGYIMTKAYLINLVFSNFGLYFGFAEGVA